MMAGRYKSYPEYKDSKIEWIDLIPTHWEKSSLRWTSKIYSGGTPSKTVEEYWENGTVPWLNSGEVNQGVVTHVSTYITEDAYRNSSAKWIPKKSLVMALAGQGKTKGMVAQLAIDATCNQSMAAIIPNDISGSRYLFWWLTSNYQNIRNMAGGDLRDGLNLELLGSIAYPAPPDNERNIISNFLDHETAKIDILIEKQQTLIQLLNEKRQTAISHAVTKGINPNVKMRDSGIEWLEEVPEGWEIFKLKHACSEIFLGLTSKVDYVETGGVPLVRALNINGGVLNLDSTREISMEQHKQLTKYRRAKRNDVLLSKSGTIGTAAIVDIDDEFSIYESIFALRATTKVLLPEYLLIFIQSSTAKWQYERDSVGMGVSHLNLPDIQEVRIPIPSVAEQVQILENIKSQQKKFDALISRAEISVRLMQERRTALISAAVTGKIDVRNWAAPKESQTNKEVA